ncbi:VOC family protein [Pseudomonas cavernicola]|uniref:VOC family protein n=1 Tax=Pseudomonas cavernicola TaxID=2320866 RepID=A0A418XPS3_9PSED|nr:VOC family protein [Pseudomonas cavernicola]RJG14426.1 VOC family protein [Pseudomonas cavernicola]
MQWLVNIDVPDLDAAITFYTQALDLRLSRRLFDGDVAELLGGPAPLYLLHNPAGSTACVGDERDYRRHWTPLHLDFVVDDLPAACDRALAAGARSEGAIRGEVWGRIATFADPFGHGFCLLQWQGRGYAEVS